MIKEKFSKEVDWVVGLGFIGFGERFREDKTYFILLQVGDIAMFLVQDRVLLLRRCHFKLFK